MAADSWRTALIKKSKKKANLCVQDVEQVLMHFQNLIPKLQDFTYNDGVQKELFTLDGTIPVKFRGATYNIPVCVLLQEGHPHVPPLVYVRPTSTMAIKESEHVDTNGRVYHPYLHKWNYKTCNIIAFLRILCGVFGDAPPVYSKPPEQPPPARSTRQPAPSTSADHRPRQAHQQAPSTSGDQGLRPVHQQAPSTSADHRPRQAHQQAPSTSGDQGLRPTHQQTPSTGGDQGPTPAHQQTPSTGADYPPRTMQQQPPQEQQKECIVCMDNPRNSVLIPCGHLGTCMACAEQLHGTTKLCPVCRKEITEFHQVYDT